MKNKALESTLGDEFSFMKHKPGDRSTRDRRYGCGGGGGWYAMIGYCCG